MALCLSGCAAGSQERLNSAARNEVQASLVTQALDVGRGPPLPTDCRHWQTSGVTEGDRLDAALVKTDQALYQANQRVRRCANWYDGLETND